MNEQMHLAAQYLAAAGKSFLDKKDDDSHTNLGFNVDSGCLETHHLSDKNDQLLLSYQDFSLIWHSDSGTQSLQLDGATHKNALDWIAETAKRYIGMEYSYKLDYELPYSMEDFDTYRLHDVWALKELLHLRILTQLSLEKLNQTHDFNASIRIWPHHFDTGIYISLPKTNNTMGLGLAIPDDVCKEHYLYASGYNAEGKIATADFKDLSKGYWSNERFLGGILPATDTSVEEVLRFFEETIEQFKTR